MATCSAPSVSCWSGPWQGGTAPASVRPCPCHTEAAEAAGANGRAAAGCHHQLPQLPQPAGWGGSVARPHGRACRCVQPPPNPAAAPPAPSAAAASAAAAGQQRADRTTLPQPPKSCRARAGARARARASSRCGGQGQRPPQLSEGAEDAGSSSRSSSQSSAPSVSWSRRPARLLLASRLRAGAGGRGGRALAAVLGTSKACMPAAQRKHQQPQQPPPPAAHARRLLP
jgi:hypothetical protein